MRANASKPRKLQVSIPEQIDIALGNLARIGLHGSNKSEIASYILKTWLDQNLDRLGTQPENPLLRSPEEERRDG